MSKDLKPVHQHIWESCSNSLEGTWAISFGYSIFSLSLLVSWTDDNEHSWWHPISYSRWHRLKLNQHRLPLGFSRVVSQSFDIPPATTVVCRRAASSLFEYPLRLLPLTWPVSWWVELSCKILILFLLPLWWYDDMQSLWLVNIPPVPEIRPS